MRTEPGIFKDVQKKLEGFIASKKLPMEKTKVEGLDVYMGYLTFALSSFPANATKIMVSLG